MRWFCASIVALDPAIDSDADIIASEARFISAWHAAAPSLLS